MRNPYRQIMAATLLGLLLYVSGAAQDNANNGPNRFKRIIKSDLSEVTSYKSEAGKWVTEKAFLLEQTFSPEGKLVLQTSYNPDGSNRQQLRFSYDGVGRMTEKKHYSPDGLLVDSCVITYNAGGKMESSICKTPAGEVLSANTYKYDGEGREIESLLTGKGLQPVKIVKSYDDKGRLQEKVSYEVGQPLSRYTYSYDSGRETKRRVYKTKTGDAVEEIAIYDSEGKTDEYTFILNGSVSQRKVTTYNSDGSLAGEATYDRDGRLLYKSAYEYRFDREGNCVESVYLTATGKGEPVYKAVTKRTITYDKEISPKNQNPSPSRLGQTRLVLDRGRKSGATPSR
jgi:antitoxin component YwqK of YwqJK toxin-antitoxin module